MPLAALLVASVTKSLYALQNCPGASENGDWLILSPTGNIFGMPDSSPWIWRLCSACSAVLCVEAGVIAGVSGYPIIAAIMVGAGSAVLTWLAVEAHARSRPSRVAADSPSRILVALALAIVLTAAGLTRYMTHTHHWGGLGNPSATNSRHGFSPIERHGQVGREKTAEELSSEFAEAHPGVLLWPKKQTYTTLVAPPPLPGGSLFSNSRSSNPLVIPFNGVYWFFRAPDIRPPRGSREVFGTPDRFDTHSTDRTPLSMEAHQNVGTLIDLDRLRRILVAIRNTDRYPETVTLELILTNTSLPGKPSQSLGSVMVKSTPPWQLYGDRPPVAETLSFEIPAHIAIHRFDELTVVFDLDNDRAEFAAKIAIERFVIVPRGL
jgi:hypothetical protein